MDNSFVNKSLIDYAPDKIQLLYAYAILLALEDQFSHIDKYQKDINTLKIAIYTKKFSISPKLHFLIKCKYHKSLTEDLVWSIAAVYYPELFHQLTVDDAIEINANLRKLLNENFSKLELIIYGFKDFVC